MTYGKTYWLGNDKKYAERRSELMHCQLCGGHGVLTCDYETGCDEAISCGECGVSAALQQTNHDGQPTNNIFLDWNRLQGLIAKGLLIEEEAANNNKRGTL